VGDDRTRKQKRKDRAHAAGEEAAWWGGCCLLDGCLISTLALTAVAARRLARRR